MQDVLDASTPDDWRRPDPENTLYLELDSGRVVIELAPDFAPAHVANIRALARGGYWDGLSINRSHDNFVVQWGDANGEDPAKAKPLGEAKAKLPAEFTRPAEGLAFTKLPDVDGWAPEVGFSQGFPAARDPKANLAWPAHCYAAVGAGRGMEADSSNGSELYVVIGQSPRQLDRNITTVGRVISGMERLSVLPRGTGPLGFYEKPEQRTAIRAIRLAATVPEAEREPIEVFRTDTRAWDALVESRRNRRDDWYRHPAGHIDLCNIPVPVRAIPAPEKKP
nr:peptidylprolyl isomerase [Arenimonas terrae]